jgi:Pin2-interacting protein X1
MSHIKVSQKLDMLGIGAAQQKDPNGIAWKQNKDFERLLERLNADQGVKAEGDDEDEKKRKREDGDETAVKKKRRKSEPVAEVVVAETVKPVVPRHRA